jgi:MarR family transcriptional regulator for hemolysin
MHTLLKPGEKGYLLTNIGRLIYTTFEQKAAAKGYTRSHWNVLAYLEETPGMTQVRLANLMEVEPITLSRYLDRMEANGWLERRNDPQDRRVKRLFLTEKAMPELEAIKKLRDEVVVTAVAAVPDEHKALFVSILEGIKKNLMDQQ